jgi:hypothetical protein
MHNEDKAAKAATKKGEALTPSTTNPMNAGKLVKVQSDQTVAKPSETLSADEREVLAEHEGTIKQGLQTFQDVGMAFAQIRDLGLYREHGTFDDYCRDVWKVCRSKAYRELEWRLNFLRTKEAELPQKPTEDQLCTMFSQPTLPKLLS